MYKKLPIDLIIGIRGSIFLLLVFGTVYIGREYEISKSFSSIILVLKYLFTSYLIVPLLFLLKDEYIICTDINDENDRKNCQNWTLVLSPFVLIEYMAVNIIIASCEFVTKVRQILVGE